MDEIRINAQAPYSVYVGGNILDFAVGEIARLKPGKKVLLLTDKKVLSLYGRKMEQKLSEADLDCCTMAVTVGETSKTPKRLLEVWNRLALCGFSRDDCIVSLGGGVVSDLGGFAASSFMRGIDHFIFPTTLLAMCDASIGGKTGINLPQGKNLVGSFYPPKAVFCNTEFLATLPCTAYSEGMAEIIKYGLIGSEELLDKLLTGISDMNLVNRSIEIKKRYVEADEKDFGLRRYLNFGHTLAHGAEMLSHGDIPHGNAVAAGMYITTSAAVRAGLCSEDVLKTEDELYEKYSLPKTLPFPIKTLCKAALSDKKRTDTHITLIIPTARGTATQIEVPMSELASFFSQDNET